MSKRVKWINHKIKVKEYDIIKDLAEDEGFTMAAAIEYLANYYQDRINDEEMKRLRKRAEAERRDIEFMKMMTE